MSINDKKLHSRAIFCHAHRYCKGSRVLAMQQSTLVLLASCVLIRLVIIGLFPLLPQQLDNTVEFSTPVTSYKSLKEGVYLLQKGFDVYDGGVVHHSPLLVYFISLLPSSDYAVSLIHVILDALITTEFVQIGQFFYLEKYNVADWLPGVVYALNPLVILSCLSRSSVTVSHFCITTALLYTLRGNILLSSIALAFATNLSIYYGLLVIPLAALHPSSKVRFQLVLTVSSYTIAFFLISAFLNKGEWNFFNATVTTCVTFDKLIPNLGLWWYFFIEMFEMFIPFYRAVFNLFVASFIIPLTVRHKKQPLYNFVLCLGWIILTQPYPTLGNSAYWLTFVIYFKPLFGYLRYPLLSSLLFLHSIILSPIFYYIWVDLGSGNSNFFYAISLVHALALSSIIVDLCWAMLRMEYDNGKPDYTKRLTQM